LSRFRILALATATALALFGYGCASDSGGGLPTGLGGTDNGAGTGGDIGAGVRDTGGIPRRDTGGTPATGRDVSGGPVRRDTGGPSRDTGGPSRDTGGTTVPGNDTSGGGGCGNIDFEGVCDGDIMTYCNEGTVETVDCGADGLSCTYIAEGYGHDCATAPGADCYLESEQGVMLMLCSGTQAACVFEGETKATCQENIATCGNEQPLCAGNVLVLPCDVEIDVQALGFDCVSDGGTCAAAEGDSAARCVGLAEGSTCNAEGFICAEELVCADVDPESGVGTCKSKEPPVEDPTCAAYCDLVTANCIESNAQYADKAACLAYCGTSAKLPVGAAGATEGNSIGCRTHHAVAAGGAEGDMKATNCLKAGPTGGAACGGYCDNYCYLVLANCTGEQKIFEDGEACATACAELPADGNATDTAGNSVQCRLNHAATAGSNTEGGSAATNCPHAAVDGGGVCVAPDPTPTYTEHVQPFLGTKCADCHTTSGDGGHNGAATYADTQAPAALYQKCLDDQLLRGACFGVRVHDGTMPQGDGCTGDPATDAGNAACLSADEIGALDAWIAGGMPE
jgi:hypothetical protein